MTLHIYNPDPLIERLEKYAIYPYQDLKPCLGIIIKENAPKSDMCYMRSLRKKADKYGARVVVRPVNKMYDAIRAIQELRENIDIAGIIILSSFGEDADRALADMIPSRIDIDCISSSSLGQLVTNGTPIGFRNGPCTAVACYKIIEDYLGTDNFKTKKIAIVNRSLRVGRPLAEILTQHNATVTVFHSQSPITEDFSNFDIVVAATGKAKWLNENYFWRSPNTKLIVDVSTISTEEGLVGDIDKQSFYDQGYDAENCAISLTITSVPGGVGKLTPVILFAKLFRNAAYRWGKAIEDGV